MLCRSNSDNPTVEAWHSMRKAMSADANMCSFYLSRRPLLAPRRMTSDVRFDALCAWLGRVLPSPMLSIEPASADASFRSYFRITLSDEQSLTQGGAAVGTLIAMDAPPSRENCRPFVAVARSEEHTSELQSHSDLVCRLLLEKKNTHGRGLQRGTWLRGR